MEKPIEHELSEREAPRSAAMRLDTSKSNKKLWLVKVRANLAEDTFIPIGNIFRAFSVSSYDVLLFRYQLSLLTDGGLPVTILPIKGLMKIWSLEGFELQRTQQR